MADMKLRILVVEDKAIHQESARKTLAGHDVTIAKTFDEAIELIDQRGNFPYEVVLTDMMMPMSKKKLAPGIFNPGELVPYGFVVALKAALRGAKFVAMITDTNHHRGAMSAALDLLGRPEYFMTLSSGSFEASQKKRINC